MPHSVNPHNFWPRESVAPGRGLFRSVRMAVLLAALMFLASCGGPPPWPRPLQAVQDENHAIERPGERYAAATGVGCALSRPDAITNAENTAKFNLRSMMGPGRYDVEFRVLRKVPDSALICYEVKATVL